MFIEQTYVLQKILSLPSAKEICFVICFVIEWDHSNFLEITF